MKVYIAGPITGMEDYMSRFQKAEERLRKEGFIPYNPASVSAMLPEETTYEEYMNVAFALLDMCEAIYLLQGWEKSLGANREYGYALAKDYILMHSEHAPAELKCVGKEEEASSSAKPKEIKERPVKKKGIAEKDKVQIREMFLAGKSVKDIAAATGLKYNTVWYQVKGIPPAEKGNNRDRHLCKTCRYRDKKQGCNYISITGHSRGCSAEDCSVYEH